MFGDFGQLAPVGDSRMFKPNANNANSVQGHGAYLQFTSLFSLTQCVRQANDRVFCDLLLRLRDGENTLHDYHLLSQRFTGIVEQVQDFNAATRLFPIRDSVCEYNLQKLAELANPTAIIHSVHNKPAAATANANTACGLERNICLAVGAKIMLRVNLWVEKGLVNGSIGTVLRIIYTGQGPPSLPAFVICIFPGYSGPSFLPEHPHSFPVVPIQRMWSEGNNVLSRIGLPLDLAWALTIHKSQGLTLPKAVIDIGLREMSAGISFVALSRVRNIQDLLLTPFPSERITSLSAHQQICVRKAEEQRLSLLPS
jgi:hypothetical protein